MSAQNNRHVLKMSDPLWVDQWSILLQKDRLREFWPNVKMTQQEKVNAFTRFILYLTVLLFLVSGKAEYLVLGMTALGMVGIVSRTHGRNCGRELFADYPSSLEGSDARIPRTDKGCLRPTEENPFGNPLPLDGRERAACNYKDVAGDIQNLMARYNDEVSSRQFYQMPNTDIVPDVEKFGKFLFGQGPNCKSDYRVCTGSDHGPKSNVPFPPF